MRLASRLAEDKNRISTRRTLGSLESDPTHSGRQIVDGSVHVTLEAMDIAALALHMPHEPAKSPELGVASVELRGAAIDTIVMSRTVQMRVEGGESSECPMTQGAFVGIAVP